MSARVELRDQPNTMRCAIASPSRLNGKRAEARGGNVIKAWQLKKSAGVITPHPQSPSPLRGEESLPCTGRKFCNVFDAQFRCAARS